MYKDEYQEKIAFNPILQYSITPTLPALFFQVQPLTSTKPCREGLLGLAKKCWLPFDAVLYSVAASIIFTR